MSETTDHHPVLPKASLLRWEISLALLVKCLFLIGLWFLIFRWMDRPVGKPDVAAHFALPAMPSGDPSDIFPQQKKEPSHVR